MGITDNKKGQKKNQDQKKLSRSGDGKFTGSGQDNHTHGMPRFSSVPHIQAELTIKLR